MYKRIQLVIISLTFIVLFVAGKASALVQENSYVAVVKIITYYEDEFYNLVPLKYGSGVIISGDGLILTNDHVVTVKDDFNQKMPAAYLICLTEDYTKAPDCNIEADLIATDEANDLALLRLVTKDFTNKTEFEYLPLAQRNAFRGGDSVLTIGYPASGGSTVTYDFGEILGVESYNGSPWIKTDALVSYGSSGGALVDINGKLLGITTAKNDDLGFAVDLSEFSYWISQYSNKKADHQSLFNRLKDIIKKSIQYKTKEQFVDEKMGISFTKPSVWTYEYSSENSIIARETKNSDSGLISIEWIPTEIAVDAKAIDSIIKVLEIQNNCFVSGTETIGKEILKNAFKTGVKVTCPLGQEEIYQVVLPYQNYVVIVRYYLGKDQNAKYIIRDALNSVVFKGTQNYIEQKYIKNINPFFELNLQGDWRLQKHNKPSEPVIGSNKADPMSSFSVYLEELTPGQKTITNNSYFNFIKDSDIARKDLEKYSNLKGARYDYSLDFWVNSQAPREISIKYKFVDEEDGNQAKIFSSVYRIRLENRALVITFSYLTENEAEFNSALKDFEANVLSGLNLGRKESDIAKPIIEPAKTEIKQEPSKTIEEKKENKSEEIAKPNIAQSALSKSKEIKNIGKKFTGRILLQVQNKGEAWYISPKTKKAHYLANGEAAYQLMREQGAGISNKDLAKIPIGLSKVSGNDADNDGLPDPLEQALGTNKDVADTDGDGYNDKEEIASGANALGKNRSSYNTAFANSQKGKILLQVQSRGEAWYINPKDGKRYFLGKAEDAYQIMREQGMGISEKDFGSL